MSIYLTRFVNSKTKMFWEFYLSYVQELKSPLWYASKHGLTDVVKFLLEFGSNIESQDTVMIIKICIIEEVVVNICCFLLFFFRMEDPHFT